MKQIEPTYKIEMMPVASFRILNEIRMCKVQGLTS